MNNAVSPNTIRHSKINADLSTLDKLVSSLLERQKQTSSPVPQSSSSSHTRDSSTKLNRLKSLSFRNRRGSNKATTSLSSSATNQNESNIFGSAINLATNDTAIGQSSNAMPTILESGVSNSATQPQSTSINSSSLDRRHGGVRQIINSIKNAPHRFSHSMDHHRLNDESDNLTQNMLD